MPWRKTIIRKRLVHLEAKALAALKEAGMKPNAIEMISAGGTPQDIFPMRDSANSKIRKKGERFEALMIAAHSAQRALMALDEGDVWTAIDKATNAAAFALGPDSEIGKDQRTKGERRQPMLETTQAVAMALELPSTMSQNARALKASRKFGANYHTVRSAFGRELKRRTGASKTDQ